MLIAFLWALLAASLIVTWFLLRRFPRWSFLYSVIVLLVGGGVLIYRPIPHLPYEFAQLLGHAFIIAALLSATVDAYVKDRVLHEVSQDVSKYLIGYRLPEELQNRLHELMQTQWIRRNMLVRCRLVELDGNKVKLEMAISDEIQNITSETQVYQDIIEFERHEPQRVTEMRCDSDDAKCRYRYQAAGQESLAREKKDEPGVLRATGDKVKIPPVHKVLGHIYRFTARYELVYPQSHSEPLTFGKPTIGLVMEVECPEDYEFSASRGADIEGHNRWEYKRLFLTGESVRLRWAKRVAQRDRN